LNKLLLGAVLALLLAVAGCTGDRGAPPSTPGLLAAEWQKIRETCALEDGTRAVIRDLSFAVDPASREVTSLQM